MNIIEVTKQILTECPLMSQFTGGAHIDFTDNTEQSNYGLFSVGDTLIKEDIEGNQKRRHSFILYAVNQAAFDYDRLANSSFILELSNWLETYLCGNAVTYKDCNNIDRAGILKKLSCANGMLFEIPTGNISDGVKYQLQIFAEYYIESEGI